VVHGRRCQRAVLLLDDLLRLPLFEMVPPGEAEGRAAYAACVTFGKGSGHPAGLNFGDLFGYALAKVRDLPLLFKGNDFSQTDIVGTSRRIAKPGKVEDLLAGLIARMADAGAPGSPGLSAVAPRAARSSPGFSCRPAPAGCRDGRSRG